MNQAFQEESNREENLLRDCFCYMVNLFLRDLSEVEVMQLFVKNSSATKKF